MLNLTLNKILLYPLHAAVERGDLASLKRWLATGFNRESQLLNRTPLYTAILFGKSDCIVYLLEQGANPNPLIDGQPIALEYLKFEKPNLLKLLTLYGLNLNDPTFLVNTTDKKIVLENTLQKKRELDNELNKAQPYLQKADYFNAFLAYQKTGDIWYSLSADESNETYREHYQQKALSYYEKASECYIQQVSSAIISPSQHEAYAACLNQAITLCQSLREKQKTKRYSELLNQIKSKTTAVINSSRLFSPNLE